MSDWTHVAGIIRIDQVPPDFRLSKDKAIQLISEGSPVGSEGGLKFTALKTQLVDEWGYSAWWGFVAFEGDLRDFWEDDIYKFEVWLGEIPKKLEKYKAMIRQAVILVEPEHTDSVVFRFDTENGWWIKGG